jgi:hypothetical protein
VTKQLRRWARLRREQLKDSWAAGEFSAAFDTEMLVKNAGATGACSILQELMNLDYDELHEVLDNEQ